MLLNISFTLYSEEQVKQVFIPAQFALFRSSFSNKNSKSMPPAKREGHLVIGTVSAKPVLT